MTIATETSLTEREAAVLVREQALSSAWQKKRQPIDDLIDAFVWMRRKKKGAHITSLQSQMSTPARRNPPSTSPILDPPDVLERESAPLYPSAIGLMTKPYFHQRK
jgi:hypothetical protein